MATPIRIKRSAVPGKKPTTDLQLGELALNTHDAELYTRRSRPGIGDDIVRLGAGATVTNILYVTKDGNDENTGKKLGDAKATISAAVAAAEQGTVIRVSAGSYVEDNPIKLPKQISVVGDSLREVSVTPQNQGDLFHVSTGNYVAEMSFVGSANTGAIFAFDPEKPTYSDQSPYIQNCTNFIPNSIGLKIDGLDSVGPLKSMVLDSYTQYNQGGIGCSITNEGYAQLVSMFTICNDVAVYSGSGGACDLTNSNSSFGTYGLVAEGRGPVKFTGTSIGTVDENSDTFAVNIDANNPTLNVFDATYDNVSGFATITTDLDHNYTVGMGVTLAGLGFTCPSNSGISTTIFPSGTNGYVFEVRQINSGSSFTVAVGPSTVPHTYTSGGTVKLNTVRPFDGQVVYFGDLYNSVGNIVIGAGGTGYTRNPVVTIGAPSTPWGIRATAVAEVKNGTVTGIEMVSNGRGYTSLPSITIAPPNVGSNGASASIELIPTYYSVQSATPVIGGISTITVNDNLPYELPAGSNIPFFKQSRVLASGHSFEYIGSGVTMNAALPQQGGVVIPENEVDMRDGGLVVYTSTDQTGNFRIGEGVVVNQQTGVISGRFYSKSLFSTMTPFILALGGD